MFSLTFRWVGLVVLPAQIQQSKFNITVEEANNRYVIAAVGLFLSCALAAVSFPSPLVPHPSCSVGLPHLFIARLCW